jgi:hypothetical protein
MTVLHIRSNTRVPEGVSCSEDMVTVSNSTTALERLRNSLSNRVLATDSNARSLLTVSSLRAVEFGRSTNAAVHSMKTTDIIVSNRLDYNPCCAKGRTQTRRINHPPALLGVCSTCAKFTSNHSHSFTEAARWRSSRAQ